MFVKTINLPLYGLDIVVVIDDWMAAHKRFKLNIVEGDLSAQAMTVEDFMDQRGELYLLFKKEDLKYGTLIHEIIHATLFVCRHTDIKLDVNNQEPITYLGDFIGEEVFKIVDKYKCSNNYKI